MYEGPVYPVSYSVHFDDLYTNFKVKKIRISKERAEEVYGMSFQNLLALILRDFFRILLPDIVRKNIAFKLPPGTRAWIEVHPITGEEFKKVRQLGGFEGVDYIATNFTGYRVYLKWRTVYQEYKKPIYITSTLAHELLNAANSGKKFGAGDYRTVEDYVEAVQKKHTIFTREEIKNILSYGLRMYWYVNHKKCDVFTCDNRDSIFMFTGMLFINPLSWFDQAMFKWRMKERFLFRIQRKVWDKYYYIGCSQTKHQQVVHQGGTKEFKSVTLTKVKSELYHDKMVKYIWRVPAPKDLGFRVWYPKLITTKAEFVGKNKYGKYNTSFLRGIDKGLTPLKHW